MDASMEQRICAAVLKRLDDTSNDVQSKAIACLGILLTKVQQAQVYEICDKLCRLILEGSAELRDIYSIGLKTLVVDVPQEFGAGVAQRLLRPLLAGVSSPDVAIKLECLEILGDLLKRFGAFPEVSSLHEATTTCLLAQLNHERKAVQKKATACLGAAAVVLADPLLNALVAQLLASTQESKVDVKVLITTIGQVRLACVLACLPSPLPPSSFPLLTARGY
jgi:cullin-associated NEDD8-dissociated protein 1